MPGTFSLPPQVSDPDMHHDTCVTHVPWWMPGSLISGFLWSRRWGETFPAFPVLAQPAIYVSSKRPVAQVHSNNARQRFSKIFSRDIVVYMLMTYSQTSNKRLFIIYMNDIHNASSKFHAILFADDTNLTSTLCSFDVNIDNNCNSLQLSTNINKELKNIQIWLEINKLSLNVKKTKFMIFHHKQRNIGNLIPQLN